MLCLRKKGLDELTRNIILRYMGIMDVNFRVIDGAIERY